jgi:predicted RNase H-like HicB family nuclease
MASGSSGSADVAVIDALTVLIRREADGTFVSEVIDLPGCTARAGTRDGLLDATRRAMSAFLGR